ncbi:MAG: thioredoxin [Bacillota bacterium]|jgi:thioredoxin 1
MKIVEVTDKEFEESVSNNEKPVLVDFWAPWCGPCKQLNPVLDEVATELGEKIKICKLNVEENPDVAGRFEIRSIPTLMMFQDGKMVEKKPGAPSKQELLKWLEEYVASE